MTIYAWVRARAFPDLPTPGKQLFDVARETQVSADCYWQARRQESPLLLALHGLEGSSEAHYMRGLASKAFAAGFSVVLLNQRNCGGTEHLSPGLYHSGLTEDAAFVIAAMSREGIDRIAVAGYSLGGNLALKLAGDFGSDAPSALRAVCAVSPIIEVSRCVHALEHRQNFVYQWNFVKDLKARMRRKAQCFPSAFALDKLPSVRTVRQFDDVYTAPYFGFRDAEDYYHRASAMRVVDRIRVPTLIISAADDPFVPASMFESPALRNNPNITTLVTRHGGHCGFVADPRTVNGDGDGYWAETSVIRFACGFC
jgi:predicted alpha/beta-fold hydrolase